MKKKVKIVLITLLCLLVVGGIVFASISVINQTNKDKKKQEKIEKEIIDNFDKFKEAVEGFNVEWSTYNSIIKSDINKNTVYQYDGWILSLDTYTESLDKIEEASKVYKKNCINKYYVNHNVNNKCEAFMIAYEQAVNTYVEDIEDFNKKIEEINESDKKELKTYELKYKKVDINNDKEYSIVPIEK